MRYTLTRIAAVCGGNLAGPDRGVTAVFVDSRNSVAHDGSLFVAIGGRNHDGHSYINELYARGVRAFLIERDVRTENYPDAGFVRVEGSVAALQALAADHRSQFRGTVVGVTGSNGKTVVKEWIAALVPPGVKLFRSPKSYNSQIGVPLSILMMRGDEDVAVVEAGISEPGEMALLEKIIRPQIGIITNIGDAHQENFDSPEQKAAEKLALFAGSHTLIYNSDCPVVERELGRMYPDRQLIDAADQREAYSALCDRASRQNAAAALALCDLLGYDHAQTVARLPELQPIAMRLELKEGLGGSIIVNDSYNSDINSLSIALDYLAGVAAGRPQTLIISDILQSGMPERELYAKVARLIARSGVEQVVGVGEAIRRNEALFTTPARFYHTASEFLRMTTPEDIAGRALLLKGNRGSRFERLSHALSRQSHTTTLEVDLDALVANLNLHRARLRPGVRTMAMVKASSYGNGSYQIARELQRQGVDYLAVAFADEGVVLRERGIDMPVVVLNADSDSFEVMVAHRLEPEIYNMTSLADFLAVLRRHGERDYPVHVKLDTGMHRLGFAEEDMGDLAAMLEKNDLVRVASVFSHLACSDDAAQDEFTRTQGGRFERMSERLMSVLTYRPLRHIANSAAVMRLPEHLHYDMVRLGIGLYGAGMEGVGLHPVSTLRTRVVQTRRLEAGETVGYAREGAVTAQTRIAVIPVGYADGLDRHLGNGRWSVLIGGRPAPTFGRISMDTSAVDVTGLGVEEGDQVVIFGPQPGNTVEDMARVLGTIPYEVMTGIAPRVKRIYVKE